MTLSKVGDLERAIASLPPEKQAEIIAQAMLTAKMVQEHTRPPKTTRAETTSELFSDWLVKHGYSGTPKECSQTGRAYSNDVMHFAQWRLGKEEPHLDELDLTQVMTEDCDRYLAFLLSLESKGIITRATVRRRLASLKSFLKYAQETNFILANPISKTKTPSARKTSKNRVLKQSEVISILNEAKKAVKNADTGFSKQQAVRDWLVLELLYIGAFRVSEISGLTWSQIDATETGNGKISVIGKGDKERDVIIPPSFLIHLQTARTTKDPREPVFKSRTGGTAICDRTIRRIVTKYATLADLDTIPSPHWLRHSHATHALKNGASVKVTTNTLGHASASTLLDNYVHAGDEESSSFYLVIE